jgi:hypothetical protein
LNQQISVITAKSVGGVADRCVLMRIRELTARIRGFPPEKVV